MKHNVRRFQKAMQGHAGSLLYYAPVVFCGVLPHCSLLCRTVRHVREWFRDPFLAFCGIWFLFVLVFFSLSGTKLPHYVLAGFTPLCILMAAHAPRLRSRLWLVLPGWLLAIACLALPALVPAVAPYIHKDVYRVLVSNAQGVFDASYWTVSACVALLLTGCLLARGLSPTWRLTAAGLVCLISVNAALLPAVGRLTQQPFKELGLLAKQHELTVVSWQLRNPSFMFYAQRMAPKREPAPGETVLTHRVALEQFQRYEIVHERHGIVLARIVER
jgi:4-amino-4-deoxy-L-arabinose transferase-like glycosyltransferase